MCQAFSCLVVPNGDVKWKFGIDSHAVLAEIFGLRDNHPGQIPFAKAEIKPNNKNYLKPDKWTLHIDERVKPEWWTLEDEKACFVEHGKWLRKLNRILVKKSIASPFTVSRTGKITKSNIRLLEEWASICDSVWDSDGAWFFSSVLTSVGVSVWNSVEFSIKELVWNSVLVSVLAPLGRSARDSIWDSILVVVSAYAGSFFRLPQWSQTGYPFRSAVALWEAGLVPSFDGKRWRLHGGKNAKVLWEGKI